MIRTNVKTTQFTNSIPVSIDSVGEKWIDDISNLSYGQDRDRSYVFLRQESTESLLWLANYCFTGTGTQQDPIKYTGNSYNVTFGLINAYSVPWGSGVWLDGVTLILSTPGEPNTPANPVIASTQNIQGTPFVTQPFTLYGSPIIVGYPDGGVPHIAQVTAQDGNKAIHIVLDSYGGGS